MKKSQKMQNLFFQNSTLYFPPFFITFQTSKPSENFKRTIIFHKHAQDLRLDCECSFSIQKIKILCNLTNPIGFENYYLRWKMRMFHIRGWISKSINARDLIFFTSC